MNFDVIIVGAGPAGTATATSLAQQGYSVMMLDRANFPRDKTCGDGLTPRAIAVLDTLGVKHKVLEKAQVINKAAVVAPNGRQLIADIHQEQQFPGYMLAIPRMDLDNILFDHAVEAGAGFVGGFKAQDIVQQNDKVEVSGLHEGNSKTFRSKFLVIATGANMGLLKKTGFLKETPQTIIAARAYFEGADHSRETFNFHFNDVTLPGYGWIFPLTGDRINVGVGVIPGKKKEALDIKKLFSHFVDRPYMKKVLSGANRLGEIKSFPIRTDFSRVKTSHKRVLLAGEAAGLVNPLTGEGIDYALESGEIAAKHLAIALKKNQQHPSFDAYDEALRTIFLPVFEFSERIVGCCVNRFMLNRMIGFGSRLPSLQDALTKIVLGQKNPPRNISTSKILAKIARHALSNKNQA